MITGSVFVPGTPAPKGSTKSFVSKDRVVTIGDNPHTKPWQAIVSSYTRDATGPQIVYPTGGVHLVLMFAMPRRKAEPKRVSAHTRKPDIDKLARAVLDGLKGVLYQDDAQVISLEAKKSIAAVGDQPGVEIHWWQT